MIAGHLAHRLSASATISGLPEGLGNICDTLSWTDLDLAQELDAALDSELPSVARDGGFVKPGYSTDLDENRITSGPNTPHYRRVAEPVLRDLRRQDR